MTKVEQPKGSLPRLSKPPSRLSQLVAPKVVTTGEAFERDLAAQRNVAAQETTLPAGQQAGVPASQPPKIVSRLESRLKKSPVASNSAIKRTFRYPRALDSQLKKLVHKYNLEKPEDEPELTMEEVGVIMAKHFLGSDPEKISREAHR